LLPGGLGHLRIDALAEIPGVRELIEALGLALQEYTIDHACHRLKFTLTAPQLAELLSVRDRLVAELPQILNPNERQFLLSLVSKAPEWRLLDIAHLEQLPAVRWKMRNLEQLAKTSPRKFAEQADALKRLLG